MLISSKATSSSAKPLPTRADLAWERAILRQVQFMVKYYDRRETDYGAEFKLDVGF
ncbi:hypothetical protein HY003_03060 [Candidatus Saccharibacteria bacterium]|nr:hypothetical protein [Candidatus Saccharibacteria bacterium]MBI3338254.1 hypothetical protein [Candidatus Saccharibacteria bacterium]